ncbi:MAG: thiamine pyrophosphate-binding protein [Gammaproteobacteria bacterium]|nr:thiamine pyrophosphate-binding protein [Gammaproteobacteria bacterium]
MTEKLTGGQALVAGLQRWNVDTLFGLPGVHLDHFFAALYPVKDKIRILHSRHEQGAAYMALGYAMVTGRPGVFTVVPGPGLLNTCAALATAYACNAPVLCITSTVNLPLLEKNYGSLHEISDQPGVLAGLTKWSARANYAAEIPELMDEAFRQMLSGRPRPVALEIPPEIMGQTALMQYPNEIPIIRHPTPDPEKINAAADLLGTAKEPLIIVGGGAQDAGTEVLQLAELLQAPVISRQMGRGIVSDKHALSIQAAAGHQLWKTTDVVIGIGTRLQQVREWGIDDNLKVIRIELDPVEITRIAPPAINLVADAGEACQALYNVLKKRNVSRADQTAKFKSIKQDFRKELERTITRQVEYLDVIRDALPEDGILVDELTQVGHVTKLAMPVYQPRSLLTSG